MAHVLVIVAQRYNANELWPMLKALKAGGHTWTITAYEDVIIDERSQKGYRTNGLLRDLISMDGFDGITFVSGNPKDTEAHWKDPKCNALVLQAKAKHLPMSGICASVPALGPALRGVKVAAFPLSSVVATLIAAGALVQPVSLYTDGMVATAENEAMAKMWARNFVCLLEGLAPEYVLYPSPFKRDVRELPPIPELEFHKRYRHDVSGE